ncbi:MAG: hypothetical protein O2894_03135 [Planctomycetota bacterium]|nr:hypothetical protein [Planctomycetota bacterium]
MSRRVRHPLVSLGMFLVICGAGIAVWEHRHDLTYEPTNVVLQAQVRDDIQREIMEALAEEDCFLGIRGAISWRPNEKRYRLDIEIADGAGCEAGGRTLCERVAQIIARRTSREATVVAFDSAGREVGRAVL